MVTKKAQTRQARQPNRGGIKRRFCDVKRMQKLQPPARPKTPGDTYRCRVVTTQKGKEHVTEIRHKVKAKICARTSIRNPNPQGKPHPARGLARRPANQIQEGKPEKNGPWKKMG